MNQFPSSGSDQTVLYEFEESQNERIGSLASVMKIAGIVVLLQGAGALLGLAFMRIPPTPGMSSMYMRGFILGIGLVSLVFSVVTGVWTLSASSSFQRVVTTQGDDISNVMNAVESLRRYFSLIRILIICMLAMIPLGCLVGIVAMSR